MDAKLLELKTKTQEFKNTRRHVRSPYPEEIRQAVRDLYRSGCKLSVMSEELEISYDALQSWAIGKEKSQKMFQEIPVKQNASRLIAVSLQKGTLTLEVKLNEDQHLFIKRLIDVI